MLPHSGSKHFISPLSCPLCWFILFHLRRSAPRPCLSLPLPRLLFVSVLWAHACGGALNTASENRTAQLNSFSGAFCSSMSREYTIYSSSHYYAPVQTLTDVSDPKYTLAASCTSRCHRNVILRCTIEARGRRRGLFQRLRPVRLKMIGMFVV